MSASHGKDFVARQAFRHAASANLVAGGAGDNTLITGDTINLASLPSRPANCEFVVVARATLTASQTLTVTGSVEVSADGTNWTVLNATSTLITLSATGSTAIGINIDLIQSNLNFIRLKLTPDLSAANTDTAVVAASAVFNMLQRT